MSPERKLEIIQLYNTCLIITVGGVVPPRRKYCAKFLPNKSLQFSSHIRFGETRSEVINRVWDDLQYWMQKTVQEISD